MLLTKGLMLYHSHPLLENKKTSLQLQERAKKVRVVDGSKVVIGSHTILTA
jgi:hypothetical protein